MVQAACWPAHAATLTTGQFAAIDARVRPQALQWAARRGLQAECDGLLALAIPLADWIAARRRGAAEALLVGLAGAQGTGKSSLAELLVIALEAGLGLRALSLSLDDLYLTRAARAELARDVHPLLATRGVPGTHDVALGAALLSELLTAQAGHGVRVPRFDKARDDRCAEAEWPIAIGPFDVVLLEGWCVAARPEPEAALQAPINALEREQDRDGHYRRYVNAQLAGPYRALFDPMQALVFLAAPDLASSWEWRARQERELAARSGPGTAVMDAARLARFVQHYERISRHMLAELPTRADVVVRLDHDHRCAAVELKG